MNSIYTLTGAQSHSHELTAHLKQHGARWRNWGLPMCMGSKNRESYYHAERPGVSESLSSLFGKLTCESFDLAPRIHVVSLEITPYLSDWCNPHCMYSVHLTGEFPAQHHFRDGDLCHDLLPISHPAFFGAVSRDSLSLKLNTDPPNPLNARVPLP